MQVESSRDESGRAGGVVSDEATTLVALAERMRNRAVQPALPPEPTHMSAEASGTPRAAVVLILRERPAGLEMLLIKRAERDDDPWSGHVALPGGREEPSDASLQATALRETKEETGLDLEHDGEILGALEPLRPQARPMAIMVQPFVAALRKDSAIVASDEVAEAFWVPLTTFTGPEMATEADVKVNGTDIRVPSFRHGAYVIWGMTERIIRQLLALLAPATAL
jgi:8-oxo-dGTP pyrophosphatase MutT (NUDIX family)